MSIAAAIRSSIRHSIRPVAARNLSTTNFWDNVTQGPEDPILGISVAFNKDTNPNKINLGVGAYRDDNGKPFVLSCVRTAEDLIRGSDHEYGPITGVPAFNKVAAELVLGEDSIALKEKRVVSSQTLSGTGALSLVAAFLQRFMPGKTIYLPSPTWANHTPIFKDAGLQVAEYKYFLPATCGIDFNSMVADIEKAPNGSVILLHACAHNPTGVDPTESQWRDLSKLVKAKGHFALFDCAYQGFASGNPEKDAFAIRHFISEGHQVAVCQSFAKNFGLYGERIGALQIIAANETQARAIESQVKILVRPMYSNPPIQGARIVSTILQNKELTSQWRDEVALMANRIKGMRTRLQDGLKAAGSTRDWSHITSQIGMFCFSGLTPQQVDQLAAEHHIYMTRNGRISVAGVTSKNVDYLAKSMHTVTSQ
eukprot:TRINITY_DN188_c0_g1_i1.p1 TRINITY_DN188_c0_g1~~TRINITY_DN188_c0_g1_i1.p1  ORF type:complete len:425 (+),score=200.61 TRINITY_DN188_c0_g1_i1:67-1341(+)